MKIKFNEFLNEKKQSDIEKDIFEIIHSDDIKKEICNIYCDDSIPDLTDVWNTASFMSSADKISVWDMNKIWRALSQLEEENLCKLLELDDE
jgi:uncharacterized protein